MSKCFFFSPQLNPGITNTYVNCFIEGLAEQEYVINFKKKSISKSIDILRFSTKADVMILNWPEDIYNFKFGPLQLIISVLGIVIFKLRRGEVVWVCHNRKSHSHTNKVAQNFSRWFYKKFSDYIIVHSRDALEFFSDTSHKVFHLDHPVYPTCDIIETNTDYSNNNYETDILIWGNIAPYKGIETFIECYKAMQFTYKVLIIGKANKEYFENLLDQVKGLNIEIQDKFVEEDELRSRFSKTKLILLPYLGGDTFSSGALIHSLSSNKIILGPAIGNFMDLRKDNACLTYSDADSLAMLLRDILDDEEQYNSQLRKLQVGIQQYYMENSWQTFIKKLSSIITK